MGRTENLRVSWKREANSAIFSGIFLADPNVEEEMKTEQEKKKAGGAEGISLVNIEHLLAEDNDLNAEIAIELEDEGASVCRARMENGLWNCL